MNNPHNPIFLSDNPIGASAGQPLIDAFQENQALSDVNALRELDSIKQDMLADQRESEVLSRQTDATIDRIKALLGTS